MKYIYPIFGVIIFLIFACTKNDNLLDDLSESDLIALELMDEAYNGALLYNDSLRFCYMAPISCDSVTIYHHDKIFHQFDQMFEIHHSNYSHNNVGDDHHHEGEDNIRHGWMMHNDDGHGYEHNLETWESMMEMREIHEEVHPN